MIRRSACRKTLSMAGTMSRSGVMKPGTSALVESVRNRSTPSSPSRAKARRSVSRPSSGSWSILKSPVCSRVPAGGAHRHREGVGDRVVDRDELAVERAEPLPVALAHAERVRLDAVLLELGLDQREGQRGADERDVGLEAQQVRHRADVVLVPVGEDDGLDVVEPVLEVGEVGQDQVDAGLVVVGEEHAAVDDEQLAAVLEDGHVAADLAEAAERDDPHAAVGEGSGQL